MRFLSKKLNALVLVAVLAASSVGLAPLFAQTVTSMTGTVNMRVDITQQAALDLGTTTFNLSRAFENTFTFGAGANAVNRMFSDQRTLAASATEDLDLAGVLTDAAGQTLTFARVKVVCFKAAAANTNNVQITRPASNGVPIFLAASDGFALTPGASTCFVWPNATGVAVTASTGDLITVTNSAGSTSVTYDVIVIGAAT
jgi:hypothetical protein